MAGEVQLRVFGVGEGRPLLDPQPCPAAVSALHRPSCFKSSVEAGHENWCPFALALILRRGGSAYDLDRGSFVTAWLMMHDSGLDQWSVICLRRESAYTHIGAELRP